MLTHYFLEQDCAKLVISESVRPIDGATAAATPGTTTDVPCLDGSNTSPDPPLAGMVGIITALTSPSVNHRHTETLNNTQNDYCYSMCCSVSHWVCDAPWVAIAMSD